jgi:hypothetical protein
MTLANCKWLTLPLVPNKHVKSRDLSEEAYCTGVDTRKQLTGSNRRAVASLAEWQGFIH